MITNQLTELGKVFYFFCSDDKRCKKTQHPFQIGEKTYATNGHIMCFCDTEHIDFVYSENEVKLNLTENTIPQINYQQIIEIDYIDWIEFMQDFETRSEGHNIECGMCDGIGTLEDDLVYKNEIYSYEYECPVCDGTGLEISQQKIITDIKCFHPNDYIKFKNLYFKANYFYLLKKVKDILKHPLELISYHENEDWAKTGCMFRIGYLNIILMPVNMFGNLERQAILILNP